MDEFSSVRELPGVGDAAAKKLSKLYIYTVGDLLGYYPRDYEKKAAVTSVADCPSYFSEDKKIALRLRVKSVPSIAKRGRFTVVTVRLLDDESGMELSAVFFNQAYIKSVLKPRSVYVFYGKIKPMGGSCQFSSPEYYTENEYEKLSRTMVPVYPVTKGVTGKFLSKLIKKALDLVEFKSLPVLQGMAEDKKTALMGIHFPIDKENVKKSRERLVFDEFLIFMLKVRHLKDEKSRLKNCCPMKECPQAAAFLNSLPYSLTNAQKRTYRELLDDFSGEYLMNRLVQGDVGSGKTVIAFLGILTAVKNGYQAALMAPTEVLARQHFEEINGLFEKNGLDIRVTLLVGSLTAKQRRLAHAAISSGDTDVVIGTHALISEGVSYKKLGFVVTDEQHRFGVRQRDLLSKANEKEAGELMPHVLVMSATPIPRTLAIIIYGDLDISLIDELPGNRLSRKNCVVGPSFRNKSYEFIEKQVLEGHQALIVCPMVEESEALEVENVIDYAEKLKSTVLSKYNIAILHGRMKPSEKTEVMEAFSNGTVDILVSTTVIEVGINVPNTTVLLVENAERFGLAQLHQLRGRVGRGSWQSYCIFMCGSESKHAKEKLEILNKSNDGFKIAEEDLKQRGPGDIFGFRQSGDLCFTLGDIFTDAGILKKAADYADRILKDDPDLSKEENRPYLLALGNARQEGFARL